MAEVRTTCPYCGVGCGLLMTEARDGWAVGGDPEHPANLGRICSKGANLTGTLADGGRLLYPEVDGQRVSWDSAISKTAAQLQATIAVHGPDSVAFYVSGQLLTEDYYVANKLIKGFIGSPHIDTNSRLCMASTVAGHKRAFGADVVPGCYEDLEIADLVVLVGSNLAWCHPVLYQRLERARRDRDVKVVVIDPRRTATCDVADLHLALKPGSDVALFNGLLAYLDTAGAVDHSYILDHVTDYDEALASARKEMPDINATAEACGLPPADVALFFSLFATTQRTVTVFSQGVNQSSRGTDKVNAILNVHLATGRVGKPGSSPFSVTGQPNAMGGREVGGLANQLAAHMNPNDKYDVDRVRRYWKAPHLRPGEGLKAVDMFRAIEEGRIKALWIMGTNPAVSLPDTAQVRRALALCPTVIVSDVVADTDTLRYAHIRLPASAWGEKDGTVTNSERRISRQRPFRKSPGEARPDWRIMSDVARAMGYGAGFRYLGPSDIFREHAALSAFENSGERAFNIGGVAKISDRDYDVLRPFQWPRLSREISSDSIRLYGDGRFTFSDRRARMVALRLAAPEAALSINYPLVANNGRYRDQWHTMTRTGLSPRLSAHRPEPLLEISPQDAAAAGVSDEALARVESARGAITLRVRITDEQPQGQVFLPIHWTDHMASAAITNQLVAPVTDALSGQPESKFTPVKVTPVNTAWNGLLFVPQQVTMAGIPYWCRQSAGACHIYTLAGDDRRQIDALLQRLAVLGDGDPLHYGDAARGIMRGAWFRDQRLAACLFTAQGRPVVDRSWLEEYFAADSLGANERMGLLAGQAPGKGGCAGDRLVCSCFAVGFSAILSAVAGGQAASVEEIGRLLKAGTGCGSCVSEVKEIIRHVKPAAAA